MGSNPGELLGAQDGGPSFSSTSSVSSLLLLFDEIFHEIGSLGDIGSRIFQDCRNGPSNFQNWLVLECRWSQNDESGNPLAIPQCNEILEFKSRNVLPKIVTIGPFNEKTEAGELQIWAQWWFGSASDRRYETRMRTDKQTFTRRCTTLWARHWWHTSSMTGSGGFTPGTPVSTHKRKLKKMKRWWFSPGFSGFHPLKRIEKKIKREKKNFILFLNLLFYSNANKTF